MRKKKATKKKHTHKIACTPSNYIEQAPVLVSTMIGFVSTSGFVLIGYISLRIASSAIGLKICVIITVTTKYKSMNN